MRAFLSTCAYLAAATCWALGADTPPKESPMRGYYLISCRVQTWDLQQWKESLDCFAADGANTVIFWMAGGFRSVRYPETWQYNADHLNVRQDFVRELIDYAHQRGKKVLLGLSPFAYDGVNQYPLTHPETRGKKADGTPIAVGGIFSFGPSLCPAVEESQRFMADYAIEMSDDFYPNADGMFIESSDYGRCQCSRCKEHYYEDEFRFVRSISDHLWKRRPDATIVVYPHYFVKGKLSSQLVQGRGGGMEFDPRWSLFFTLHSADPNAQENRELMAKARHCLMWDTAPIWGGPAQIRAGSQAARRLGADYFPTLEGYAYRGTRPEYDGEQFIVGRQLKPFGLEWLPDGKHCYNDPLVRLNRLAYREFSKNPDLDDDTFRKTVQRELFGPGAGPQCVEDLYSLVNSVLADRQNSFFFASPLVIPQRIEAKAKAEKWPENRIAEYRRKVEDLRAIAARHSNATDPMERELHHIAAFIVRQWDSK